MGTKNRQMYEAPATEVVEVKAEGVICGSGPENVMLFMGADSGVPLTDGVLDYSGQSVQNW